MHALLESVSFVTIPVSVFGMDKDVISECCILDKMFCLNRVL